MIWFTSDSHFGHANIIKFCRRPFDTVDDMNDVLIRRWNEVVKPEDTVYHLGDVSLKISTPKTISILKQLNGIKRLLIGNHDHHHLKNQSFRDCFEQIEHYYELKHNGKLYVLQHYPFLSWNGSNRGSVNLAGHRHLLQQESNILRFDVGVDANSYSPVSIDYIEQWAEQTKAQIKTNHNTDQDRRGTMKNEGLESYNERRITLDQKLESLPPERQAKVEAKRITAFDRYLDQQLESPSFAFGYYKWRVFFYIKDILIRLFN
jgi:calcineurin-like phosphoesterase family protein